MRQSSLSEAKLLTNEAMNDREQRILEDYFKAIEANLVGYQDSSFSYFALKNGETFDLSQGRLALQCAPASIPSSGFQSENIKAGIFRLSEVNMTPKSFVEGLLTGRLRTPQGDLQFQSGPDRSHSLYPSFYHPDGISAQRRQIHLTITGSGRQRSHRPSEN